MKFIYEKETQEKKLTLNHVEYNQFFVCANGYLCQKMNDDTYVTIADDEGNPSCDSYADRGDTPIQRVLPIVEKIEF